VADFCLQRENLQLGFAGLRRSPPQNNSRSRSGQ